MTKTELVNNIAQKTGVTKQQARHMVEAYADVALAAVKVEGQVTLPGIARIKKKVKPAQASGEKLIFGQLKKVKAQPAKEVLKAFPVKAAKDEVLGGGAKRKAAAPKKAAAKKTARKGAKKR